jgi:diguanylate cyclase (GGDEF)-like protein/PAS domain S-box-containing protein
MTQRSSLISGHDETGAKGGADELQVVNAELRANIARFETAFNNMSQGMLMFDSQERVVICNDFYIDMYGLSRDVAKPGCPLIDLLRHRVATGGDLNRDPEQYRLELLHGLAEGRVVSLIVKTAQGRDVLVKNSPMPAGGWVATHEDITERRRAEAQIAYMAHHDPLTGLFNRARFQQELELRLGRAARSECFAVFCLDLDRFKEVNDTLGHPIGDLLLQTVACRLRDVISETDILARLAGDEFAILQTGARQPTRASSLASRILDEVSAPYELASHQVVIEASIGIALVPDDGLDTNTLIRKADVALYKAKADGRNLYRFFEPEMDARMQARRQLEMDLRKAIAAEEFELFYQPAIDLKTREPTTFEALIRWRHPARGLLLPIDFIPIAEETGIIIPLGNWVLRRACVEAAEWPNAFRVAVNLSPTQFRSKGLVQTVMDALGASGLPPTRLELEITETVLLQDCDSTLATLHQLRANGIRIAMDDFGTGYSSLSYLRKFPFDKIKIDQSFVHDMSDHGDCLAIVRAVVAMGGGLSIATTAEGVETQEQLELLTDEGCSEAQGYLFSPPRPAADIKAWLASLPLRSATS